MKKLFIASMFAFLAFTTSCSKDELDSPALRAEQAGDTTDGADVSVVDGPVTPVNLDLEADLEAEIQELDLDDTDGGMRNLKYGFKNVADKSVVGWDGVLEQKDLYSLCVIAPTTGMTDANTYYCKLTWKRTAGKNHFSVKVENLKDINGKAVNLSKGSWRICGYMTYNNANITTTASAKTVKYEPNKTFTTGIGAADKVVKDIPLYFSWVNLKVETSGTGTAAVVTDAAALAKHSNQIKVKPMGSLVRVSLTNKSGFKMRVKSIRVETNGFVSGTGLAGWQTGAGVKPSIVAVQDAYTSTAGTNGGKEETTYTLGNIDIDAGATYGKSFVLWVMPVDLRENGGAKYTKVFAEAVRLDGTTQKKFPEMKNLYGYWSTTNNLEKSKRYHMGVTLYRPKTALEYISNGYRTNSGFSITGARYYSRADVVNLDTSVPGYRVLRGIDFRTLFGRTREGAVQFKSDGKITNVTNSEYRFGETKSGGYNDVFKNGESTIYALRFDGGSPNRIQYSAWRYVTSKDTGQPYIDCVHLGPNFKGTIDDIAQDSFWAFHADDRVRRLYAKGGAYFSPTPPRINPERVEAELLVTHIYPDGPDAYILVSDDSNRNIYRWFTKRDRRTSTYRAPLIMVQTHDNFDNTNL